MDEQLKGGLHVVTDVQAIRDNFARYSKAFGQGLTAALDLARTAHYWILDAESGEFAPCLFLAYF